jgi:hypothetical protein
MALLKRFVRKNMERNSIHDPIEATYTIFENDGRAFVQIDTYGRIHRKKPGKKSQTIQLDKEAAMALMGILQRAFHLT